MPICTAFVLATTKAPKNRRSQVRGPALPEIGAARTIHPVDSGAFMHAGQWSHSETREWAWPKNIDWRLAHQREREIGAFWGLWDTNEQHKFRAPSILDNKAWKKGASRPPFLVWLFEFTNDVRGIRFRCNELLCPSVLSPPWLRVPLRLLAGSAFQQNQNLGFCPFHGRGWLWLVRPLHELRTLLSGQSHQLPKQGFLQICSRVQN